MALNSLDIVSDYDKGEVVNAVDQAKRELTNRYDFKGTPASIEWLDEARSGIRLVGNSQYQLDAIVEIVRKKLAGRSQSQKLLDTSSEPVASNLKMTWDIVFKKGLSQDKTKKITSLVREKHPKAKVQVQGEEVRVSSSSKDELQAIMQLLRAHDFDFPIDFKNLR